MIKLKGCKFNERQLKDIKIGQKIEMEHTKNPKVALKIAKQHECEFSKVGKLYYSQGLLPMEKRLKNGH